jgi:hypothetical protein
LKRLFTVKVTIEPSVIGEAFPTELGRQATGFILLNGHSSSSNVIGVKQQAISFSAPEELTALNDI